MILGLPPTVMTMSTFCSAHRSRWLPIWSSDVFADRFTASGPTGPDACAGCSRKSAEIVRSQSANSSNERAFWRGRTPITPAMQASRTRSGPLTRNIGAQTAGKDSDCRSLGSSAMKLLLGRSSALIRGEHRDHRPVLGGLEYDVDTLPDPQQIEITIDNIAQHRDALVEPHIGDRIGRGTGTAGDADAVDLTLPGDVAPFGVAETIGAKRPRIPMRLAAGNADFHAK